jgi:hypothetical protein
MGLVASLTSSSAMWEWESMMPGVRYLPPALMTVAEGGRVDHFAEGRAAVFQVAVSDCHDVGVGDDDVIVAWGLLGGCRTKKK